MENFKNEFISECIHVGLKPEQAVKALQALAVTMQGYNIAPKESNLVLYDSNESTNKVIRLYVDCKRVEGCSAGFCTNLNLILPKLFEYTGKDVQSLSSFDIRAFLAHWQQERNVSNATLDKYRQYINGFYVWLNSEGYTGKNPCLSIKKIKTEKKQAESLSSSELEYIRFGAITPRERMIIELLTGTGCRVAELASIKISDIQFEGEHPHITVIGKGKKQRDLPLLPKTKIAIKTYLSLRGYNSLYLCANEKNHNQPVKTATIRSIIRTIESRITGNISHHLHPHLFRHTVITHALNKGVPLQEVQRIAGHSNIDTTVSYAVVDRNKAMADFALALG